MRVGAKAFWLPKAGNAPEEYEDACWPERLPSLDAPMARFAVADGAAETSFSGPWAKLLVKAYHSGDFKNPDVESPLERLRSKWHELLQDKQLPWYAEEKLQMGAFSSLLGMTVRPGSWEALAVGDSCLFHVRKNALLTAFPLERSEQFNNRPLLLSTKPSGQESIVDPFARKQGEWLPGDIFYLMTDAMAQWLLRRQEDDGKGLMGLSDIRTAGQFDSFVHSEREQLDANGRPWLRNDDVTLVRVELSKGGDD